MSIPLVVNNTTFNYPDPGEDVGWAEDASGWAEEVTTVLSSLLSTGDILLATFNVANNVSVFTDIVGLAFTAGLVRSVNVQYSLYRISTGSPSGNAETGTLSIVYDNNASSGNKWLLSQTATGDGGIIFDITDLGQFQYKTTDIGTPGYQGVLKFKAIYSTINI